MRATTVHLVLLALIVSGSAGASERSSTSNFSTLLTSSAKFCEKPGDSENSCYDRLSYYFDEIYEMDESELSENVDDSAILAIAELLKSESYPKRFKAVRILGAMGKRATVALPSLRAAEAEAGATADLLSMMGNTAIQKSIRLAIQRIEGTR
ncbi:hypothetical protein JR063_16215 [Xanthomonas sp. CFBP 8700]|nr:hypothetical protein [Xanthomonas bonasiae]